MRKIESQDILKLQSLVGQATRIVITCHVSPDGDAMGSSLALWHVLKDMGKRPAVVTPDAPPRSLMFLPGAHDVIVASRYSEKAKVHIAAADLIVCLDFNALSRIDKLQSLIEGSKAPKILIDHHLSPEDWPDVLISRPEASSTCYLLYKVLEDARWDEFITTDAASCIYTGMMTDTGNFSFNSNDPGLYETIAALLRKGIDKDYLYKMACDTKTLNQLRLNSYALSQKLTIFPEHKAAVIVLSQADLQEYSYVKGDTEGLVNVPLSVPEITWSTFIREDEGQIKFSLRSKGNFPVNKICEDYLGGGGHKNAAGGELHCSLPEAVETFLSVMSEYDKYL